MKSHSHSYISNITPGISMGIWFCETTTCYGDSFAKAGVVKAGVATDMRDKYSYPYQHN